MAQYGLIGGGAPQSQAVDPATLASVPVAQPGFLDYALGIFNGQSPYDINQGYNSQLLARRAMAAQLAQQQALQSWTMGQGGPSQAPSPAPPQGASAQAPAPQAAPDDVSALLSSTGTPDSAGGVQPPVTPAPPMGFIGGGAPVQPNAPAAAPAPRSPFLNADGSRKTFQQISDQLTPMLLSPYPAVASGAKAILDQVKAAQPHYTFQNGVGAMDDATGSVAPGSPLGTKMMVAPSGTSYNEYNQSSLPKVGNAAPPIPGAQVMYDGQGRVAGYSDPGGSVLALNAADAAAKAYADNQARATFTPVMVKDGSGAEHPVSQLAAVGGAQPGVPGGVAPMPGAPVYNPQGQAPQAGGMVGPSTAASAEQQATGTAASSDATGYQKAAELARARQVQLQRAIALNNSGALGQGAVNPSLSQMASVMSSMGARNPNLPLQEDYQNIVGNLFKTGGVVSGTDADTKGGNGMTNIRSPKEWQWMMSQYPNLSKTQAGRARILANELADTNRITSIGRAAENWIQKYHGLSVRDPQGSTFEAQKGAYLNANPLAQ